MKTYLKNYKLIVVLTVVVLGLGLLVYNNRVASGHGEDEEETPTQAIAPPTNVAVETVSDGDLDQLGATTISWGGEVLSTSDVQIYPAREGQIAEWKVRLGDRVKKGQVIGRLTPPPASIELSSALAERSGALIRAREHAKATEKLVQESKNQLAALKEKLDRSRDTALAVIDKEAQKNVQSSQGASKELASIEVQKIALVNSAQAELKEAESLVPLKRQAARAAFERLAKRFTGKITLYGQAPSAPDQVHYLSFSKMYGISDSTSRNTFISSLQGLLVALQDSEALPESAANKYIQDVQYMLSRSFADGNEVTSDQLNELRNIIVEDQEKLLEALKEYKEAQTSLLVKQAEINKVTAEAERQVVGAQVNAKNAELTVESTETVKQNRIAEADTEYTKQKTELDAKITELDRELQMAYAEVKSAEASYGILSSGVAGQNIIAPQTGVISAIYKNTGDHVSAEIAIAGVSSQDAKGRFVRFRIPSDMKLPAAGQEITIERPGFPLEPQKAKIIGIGLSLDSQGSYAADAEFLAPVNWPVHTSVRVLAPKNSYPGALIPFTAVWWNDAKEAQVWLVMENNVIRPQTVKLGRALGDRVEVEEGLQIGDRIVSRVTPDLKTGQSITQAENRPVNQSSSQEEKPIGNDGHGHSHDE